jgi:predicted nucleic acid-binding protein
MDTRRAVRTRSVKVALDSNILLYFARIWRATGDEAKSEVTDQMIAVLQQRATLVVPFQVLGECFNVMQRNDYTRAEAREVIREWGETYETAISAAETFDAALDLATEHKLQFWDALILSVAANAGCSLLLSEDLQPGFTWRGVRVVDPFAKKLDARLSRLITN